MAGIKWKFTTEYAPWKGGFYERLIGLTKRSLRKSLENLTVTNTELITLLVEIEAVINSRPFTYVNDDINSSEALTPGKFLSINYKTGSPNAECINNPGRFSVSNLLEMWKRGQKHLNNFWMKWMHEYLETFRERHSVHMKPIKGEIRRKPKVGEIVIIKEDDLPRGSWKMAKVQNLIEGDVDKLHRAATLLLPSGRIMKRPFRYIYPLEGTINDKIEDKIEVEENANNLKTISKNSRNIRASAVIARQKIHDAMQ